MIIQKQVPKSVGAQSDGAQSDAPSPSIHQMAHVIRLRQLMHRALFSSGALEALVLGSCIVCNLHGSSAARPQAPLTQRLFSFFFLY